MYWISFNSKYGITKWQTWFGTFIIERVWLPPKDKEIVELALINYAMRSRCRPYFRWTPLIRVFREGKSRIALALNTIDKYFKYL